MRSWMTSLAMVIACGVAAYGRPQDPGEVRKQVAELLARSKALGKDLDYLGQVNRNYKETKDLLKAALKPSLSNPSPEVIARLERKGFKYSTAAKQLEFRYRDPETLQPKAYVVSDIEQFRQFMLELLRKIDVEVGMVCVKARLVLAWLDKGQTENHRGSVGP